jgi:hypothetical protein
VVGWLLALPAFALTLEHDPLVAGGWHEVRVTDAAPGVPVHLFVSAGITPGLGACPVPLGGLCLDLAPGEVYMGNAVADATGLATLWLPLQPLQAGNTVALQAVVSQPVPEASAAVEQVVADRVGPWGTLGLFAADARLDGMALGDLAGSYVSDAGDLDADGLGDILVGARRADGPGLDRGVVYVLHGPVSSMDLAGADARLFGESNDDYAGYRLAPAGDTNADGFDDILVGSFGEDTGGLFAGAAYLVHGPLSGDLDLGTAAAAKFVGEAAQDKAGYGVGGAGDVDDDGYDDLVIGAYTADNTFPDAGTAYLMYGPVTGTIDLAFADVILTGEAAGDFAGIRVDGAGDTDGDGFGDVVIGAHYDDTTANDAGSAYLLTGPVAHGTYDLGAVHHQKWLGEARGDYAGLRVSGAGDTDGDGLDDFVISGFHDGPSGGQDQSGVMYLVRGGRGPGVRTLDDADAEVVAVAQTGLRGVEVSDAGDVNGDGFADLIMGAKFEDGPGGADAGAAYLVLGPVAGVVEADAVDARFWGEKRLDWLGYSVSSAGDTDGDGYDDLLLGAYGTDYGAPQAGSAYLFLGAP